MDASSDYVLMPLQTAQLLQNVFADRQGLLRTPISLADVLGGGVYGPIDGVAWFYGATAATDRALWISGGACWHSPVVYNANGQPSVTNPQIAGYGFAIGKAVRSVSYNQELIFVQSGGIQPLRYDGTAVYQLGISQPVAPTAVQGMPSAGAASNKFGTITYKQTLFDSRFRESSPSPGAAATFTAGKDAYVTPNYGADPQVKGAYLYANTQGGAVWYRIATVLKTDALQTFEDNLSDNLVSAASSTIAPNAAENDPPQMASVVTVHKNHVFMNSTANSQVLQLNNTDAPTQWAVIPALSTDGERITIGSDQGDIIVALVPFGSLLGVFKRKHLYMLWGDDQNDFTVRPIHDRPCIAPLSATRCDNYLNYLTDDGVFTLAYENGFIVRKISLEMETLIGKFSRAQQESAVGWFTTNRYHLQIGGTTLIFDYDAGGAWSTLVL